MKVKEKLLITAFIGWFLAAAVVGLCFGFGAGSVIMLLGSLMGALYDQWTEWLAWKRHEIERQERRLADELFEHFLKNQR